VFQNASGKSGKIWENARESMGTIGNVQFHQMKGRNNGADCAARISS
jgi:hypothetical protein